MATREPVITQPAGNVVMTTWTLTANGDVGRGIKRPDFPDKTVGIRGTFDTTTIVLEGSFDSTDGVNGFWYTITDPQANSISKTNVALESALENILWVRPRCSAGGAGTNVIVELMSAKHYH